MKTQNFRNNKLGSGSKLVQFDKKMLKYKCKSHRGRSPENRTDSLSIIEFDGGITRCFACIIPNISASTIIPIICENVCSGTTIHTDERGAYNSLQRIGFIHGTVCHKYTFMNRLGNVICKQWNHSTLKLKGL
jgi:transposase-like protein